MKSLRPAVLALFLYFAVSAFATPAITGLTPDSGAVGGTVTIAGTNFGATQGASTVTLNTTSAVVASWSDTAIVAIVPAGASSGPFSVTVGGQTATSPAFTVTPLPSGWLDQDIGPVGVSGSGTYANGAFTVQGAGQQVYGTSDTFHFLYRPLSGDGAVVARVVSVQGYSNYGLAGVMVRETLEPWASNAKTADWAYYGTIYFDVRAAAGGSTTEPGSLGVALPYWVKVVRSGSTFISYVAPDGVNWVQIGGGPDHQHGAERLCGFGGDQWQQLGPGHGRLR